ncbi:MAG: hypothetical protein NT155_04570 [Candidatus Staskawiczbacteria bacterium]|nr:hypothetical protein [Candidatus Staskawiczbacteria bacterium]
MNKINKLIVSAVFLLMTFVALYSTATAVLACQTRDYKQCHGNAVYWYDHCGYIEDLFQQCSANQVCQNAQCVNIACSSNSQCGTSGLTGSPSCQGNGVYQNYVTYTCNNPGTASSSCSNSTTTQLQTTCSGSQTCSNGSCTAVACSSSSQCGTSGLTGSLFCQGNAVYQNYTTYTCNNPGTASSSCTNSTTAQMQTACPGSQTCQNAQCITSCTSNYQQRCSGNAVYWYDSCGTQQNLIQYCQNGCSGNSCQNNYNYASVQTNSATNINNNQATLNGYLSGSNNYGCNNYVWFQWGSNYSYGNDTIHQQQNYTGNFSQTVNLYNNTGNNSYHFRAAAQDCSGNVIYGQDMTVYNNVQGNLTVSKTVRNLTNGSTFANSTYANPSDMLMFMITLQTSGNQDIQNVVVRDSLPANLVYNNQLVVARSNNTSNNYSGDIVSGINLSTISAGQTVTITYQAQLASAQSFSFGTTTLTNNVSVTSSNSTSSPVANASVVVTRSAVLGASSVSTGLTNNFWIDSFFLPLLITLIGLWMWKAGMFFGIEKWLDNKKKTRRIYKAEKELSTKISKIQKFGNK